MAYKEASAAYSEQDNKVVGLEGKWDVYPEVEFTVHAFRPAQHS